MADNEKILNEVDCRNWHYSYRAHDDHAAIVTDHGYCVAVRPKLFSNDDWKPVAEYICAVHNNKFVSYPHIVKM